MDLNIIWKHVGLEGRVLVLLHEWMSESLQTILFSGEKAETEKGAQICLHTKSFITYFYMCMLLFSRYKSLFDDKKKLEKILKNWAKPGGYKKQQHDHCCISL